MACERYQNLSEEERDKKCQYACERYIEIVLKKKKKSMIKALLSMRRGTVEKIMRCSFTVTKRIQNILEARLKLCSGR